MLYIYTSFTDRYRISPFQSPPFVTLVPTTLKNYKQEEWLYQGDDQDREVFFCPKNRPGYGERETGHWVSTSTTHKLTLRACNAVTEETRKQSCSLLSWIHTWRFTFYTVLQIVALSNLTKVSGGFYISMISVQIPM